MEILRIGALGLCGVMLAVYFRQVKPEYGIYIGVATGFLIFFYTIQQLAVFLEQIAALKGMVEGISGFLLVLLRVIGITYICEFCAGICRDAGYGAVAGQIEIFGRTLVLLAGLPILLSVLETVQGFTG